LKQIRRHVTYANVMSSIAVFLMLGGATAFAATKIGANEIKANSIKTGKIVKEAVTAGKIKKNAVTESRIADGAVTTNKLADNAVTTPKIANDAVTTGKLAASAVSTGKLENGAVNTAKLGNGAVTAAKLAESEQSQALVTSPTNEVNLPEQYGSPNNWATVLTLNVPSGNWVLSSHIQVAIGTASPGSKVICRMNQNGSVLSQTGTEGSNLGLIPSINGVDLTAVTTAAGTVTVTCADSADGVGAIARTLIAIRAGSVN
jgi:hypothetical protein